MSENQPNQNPQNEKNNEHLSISQPIDNAVKVENDNQPNPVIENSQPITPTPTTPMLVATPKKSAKIWILLAILLLALAFFWAVYQTVFSPISQKKQMMTVEKGETYHGLIDKWSTKNQGFFLKPLAKLYVKMHVKKPLHSGIYQLPDNPSFAQMLSVLQQGEKVAFVKVQIIEGKTAKDLYHVLRDNDGIQTEILSDNLLTPQDLGVNLPEKYAPNGNMEGWFSPDTYYFTEGSSDKKVLADLFNRQYTALMKAWEKRQADLPYATPYEALIMASIIEKETSVASERGEVAGVFVNRLRKKMRLQTDPTVIYGMGERYDGNIRKADLQEKTAYNTYQIDGLPPTPIALPSIASIEASLNPNQTDSLYFVATGHGGHKFTSNLADHNKAVQAYLKVMREKKANQ
ncbi:endolytic transglycosylase MltG [Faucicola boevrei]|uniref:endolytic transglycosylase MltG n=1 Tax=Faucicola boevrei TaxID=346665 RepID=UPI000360943D|nr:endolytic transglycosylase MltG [Moraxella boevrei]